MDKVIEYKFGIWADVIQHWERTQAWISWQSELPPSMRAVVWHLGRQCRVAFVLRPNPGRPGTLAKIAILLPADRHIPDQKLLPWTK